MTTIDRKMTLSAKASAAAEAAFADAGEAYLATNPSVVGVASGVKWTNGQPTGKPAVLVFVEYKHPPELVPADEMVPDTLGGEQTDVVEVGSIFAGFDTAADPGAGVDIETLARRIRPAEGGWSVAHVKVTAGTIATGVYDRQPQGIGVPRQYYILSNNHVLANSNNAAIGDPILQPGPYDGGVLPSDLIARLSRFVPIEFFPGKPLAAHRNLVDAAIASGQFHDIDREIYWIGNLRGWQRKSKIAVGDRVMKTGRTTNFTKGRVIATNATIDVNYGGGKVARFRDQIVTTNMSAGGDSGSLVTTLDNVAAGLLFAGSNQVTICNHIEYVRALLGIEIAELEIA